MSQHTSWFIARRINRLNITWLKYWTRYHFCNNVTRDAVILSKWLSLFGFFIILVAVSILGDGCVPCWQIYPARAGWCIYDVEARQIPLPFSGQPATSHTIPSCYAVFQSKNHHKSHRHSPHINKEPAILDSQASNPTETHPIDIILTSITQTFSPSRRRNQHNKPGIPYLYSIWMSTTVSPSF